MLTLAGVTFLFTFHNMNNAYLIKVIENVGGTSADMGRMLSIAAVTELPVMFLFSRISKHFKSSTLLIVSGIFFAMRAAGFMLAGNMMIMYLAATLQIGSFALYIPSSVYYVNRDYAGSGQIQRTGSHDSHQHPGRRLWKPSWRLSH